MTKSEMVDGIAKAAGITKKAATDALEAITEPITKDLKKGNNVVLTGFGTFRVSKRAPPAPVSIPAIPNKRSRSQR